MDDYSAWVTGESADSNRPGIEAIIEQALDWERRNGAAFEGEKTAIIHFTRRNQESEISPFVIKGQAVSAKDATKILGVTMDAQLRYKEHVSRVSSKGLLAAMALWRLGTVLPATARRLYEATVTPVTDYAREVWKHACGLKEWLSWQGYNESAPRRSQEHSVQWQQQWRKQKPVFVR